MDSAPVNRSTLRLGALGAALASVALASLALVPRPFEIDHRAIFMGLTWLDEGETHAYLAYLRINLTIDSVYLLGQAVMWLGLAALLRQRSRLLAMLVVALGLGAVGLDLAENEVRWMLARGLRDGLGGSAVWGQIWSVLVGLSFWPLFLAGLVTALGLADDRRWPEPLVAALGGLGAVTGCLVYVAGYRPAFIWLIGFHAAVAVLLSRRASEAQAPPGAPAVPEAKNLDTSSV